MIGGWALAGAPLVWGGRAEAAQARSAADSLAGPVAAVRRGEALLGLVPASWLYRGSGLDFGAPAAGCSQLPARGSWEMLLFEAETVQDLGRWAAHGARSAGRSARGRCGWWPGGAVGAVPSLYIVHLGLLEEAAPGWDDWPLGSGGWASHLAAFGAAVGLGGFMTAPVLASRCPYNMVTGPCLVRSISFTWSCRCWCTSFGLAGQRVGLSCIFYLSRVCI
ncbi:hypothetical protein NDU88_002078 [Pleurodeles waltl]|uniref:Uncharacterized protein n=1 Tax=Pleurodeles waltl TaxID=8319 RepID=A0AAV7Q8T0_PLEWA|nr:hypothetical protein NDU88_002078 [Pleurodeles waltl]